MKKLFLLVFILLSLDVASQTYSTFNKNRPAYYNFNYNYIIFYTQAGISIDSFKVSGSDTIFYHYPIIDYDNSIYTCYIKAHDTSFVGDHSIRNVNGDDEFFNRTGDTIHFKNNSVLNESWTILDLGGGNKIVATVQSINSETVLGVSDSVKEILLQAKDNFGNNISNKFNNKIFKIAKSTGLVSGYSLFHFPDDTIGFSIVGIENPSLGLSSENLTPEKIFDFEVGDEFDFYKFYTTQPTSFQIWCEIKKILSKEIIGDTLRYNIDYLSHWFFFNWGDSTFGNVDYPMITDFVVTDYSYLLLNPFESLVLEPYGNTISFSWLAASNYSTGETMKLVSRGAYFLQFNDCLLEEPNDFFPIEKFANGLGSTGYFAYNGTDYWLDTLVYFKKDSVEWGTPVDCPFGTGLHELVTPMKIILFPNPTHSQLFLTGNFNPQKNQFTLFNSLGEEMKLKLSDQMNGSLMIDVSSLSPGFYFLRVKNDEEVVNLKFMKN